MLELIIGLLLLNFFKRQRERKMRRMANLYQVVHTIHIRRTR